MHEVKVKKQELLEALVKNRNVHIEDYWDAMEGYTNAAETLLKERLQKVREKFAVDLKFNIPKPVSYEKEYDRIISMVKMSVEDELTLSSQEFAQFVMDDWGWKGAFTATNAFYNG